MAIIRQVVTSHPINDYKQIRSSLLQKYYSLLSPIKIATMIHYKQPIMSEPCVFRLAPRIYGLPTLNLGIWGCIWVHLSLTINQLSPSIQLYSLDVANHHVR